VFEDIFKADGDLSCPLEDAYPIRTKAGIHRGAFVSEVLVYLNHSYTGGDSERETLSLKQHCIN